MAARISLLGRGCGALGAERGNKTSERLFRPFCPLLDPPRFGISHEVPIEDLSAVPADLGSRHQPGGLTRARARVRVRTPPRAPAVARLPREQAGTVNVAPPWATWYTLKTRQ